MKRILSLILITLGVMANAQDSVSCYFDAQLQLVDKRKAVYTGKMIQTADGWQATANYPQGGPLMQGQFRDKKLQVRNGQYTLFYSTGGKKATASFEDNTLQGPYQSWHENGRTVDSGQMSNNTKNGVWRSWYENGFLESEGSYTDGIMDGTWKWFRDNQQPATVEVYANGKIKELSCFDSLGVNTGFDCRIDKKPCPKDQYSFESFVIENLEYPQEALRRGIEGIVDFEFFVTKDGKLTRINFTSQSNKVLQQAIVDFLKSVPAWEPAISHNREVDCLYSYQVPFQLP